MKGSPQNEHPHLVQLVVQVLADGGILEGTLQGVQLKREGN